MGKLEEALRLVDRKEEGLIATLRDIVRFDNSVPPGRNYDALVDYLEPRFSAVGMEVHRVVVPEEKIAAIPLPLEGPRVNLVAIWRSGKEPLTVYAHMDTVPVEEKWKRAPFGGQVEEGRIYGRGVTDMKGSIATLLTALEVMKELDLQPRYEIACCMCTDEEIGGYPGIYHLALEGFVKEPILCMEGFQDPKLCFWLGSAGMIDVTITAKGKSCHSGMNFLGVNALEAMVPIMEELLILKEDVEKRESEIPAFSMPGGPSPQMTPMFNLDIIDAGTKSNIVPATCTLVVNRRYIVEESPNDIEAEIRKAVERGKKRSKALDVEVRCDRMYPAARYNARTPHVERMKEAMKLVQGYRDEDFAYGGIAGSTDMAFVAETMGISNFVFCGVARPEGNVHGADENARISDLTAHAKELLYYFCA